MRPQPALTGRYVWLWIFGAAMGFFEAAVVVYLRRLYYPEGFRFPIVLASVDVALVEIAREAASIVMLAAGARLAGAFFLERFAAFMILFGVWDILYYVFLKVTLDWPESLATWDVLFLIPVPWIGPVWAPVVVSLALIGAGTYLYWTSERPRRVAARDWLVEIAGGLIVIVSFTLQWRVVVEGRLPGPFHAGVFWAGFLLALAWFVFRERQETARAAVTAQ